MRHRSGISLIAVAAAISSLLIAPAAWAATPAVPPPDRESAQVLFQRTEAALLALQQAKGTRPALRELGRRVRQHPVLEGLCHPIAHELGHEAVQLAGGGLSAAAVALQDRDDVCGGGYTHGVIESALGSSTHPKRDLLRVCAPGNDGSCFHGVGHGLMFATDMDVARSLRLCDRAPTVTLSHRCGEGVYMQVFSADLSARHSSAPGESDAAHDPDAAASTCQSARSAYVHNCWFYAPTVWLGVHVDDFAGALAWCTDEAKGAERHTCARGVGSRVVKYHPDDLSVGSTLCRRAGDLEDACLVGMGSYWSVHHEGRRAPSDVCRHLTGRSLIERCRQVLA